MPMSKGFLNRGAGKSGMGLITGQILIVSGSMVCQSHCVKVTLPEAVILRRVAFPPLKEPVEKVEFSIVRLESLPTVTVPNVEPTA